MSGLRWSVLDQLINQITVFGVGFLLMQLLPPTSFGLLGMVTVFSGFLSVFKDFGLGSSIIQKKVISQVDISTVFWATVLLGFILSCTLFLLSSAISIYYGEPQLESIAQMLSLVFIIQALSSIQLTLLRKKMLFKDLFIINVTSTILSGITAISLAFSGFGVWALVAQQLVSSIAITLLLFIRSGFCPKLKFDKKILGSHLNFSLPLVGQGSLNYWARNADSLLIGSNLGAESLGLYNRAYSFMMLPISRISGVISSVMFPSLSIIQDDHERLKDIFLKVTRLIAFVTLPLMVGLIFGANSFVRFFFTEDWFPLIKILEVLALVGAVQSIGTLNGNIFLVKAKTLLQFKLTTLNSLVYVIGFYFTSKIGLLEVVILYCISSWILLAVNWVFLSKVLGVPFLNLFSNLSFHFIALLSLCFLFILSKDYWQNILSPVIELSLVVVLIPTVWVLYFWLIKKEFILEAIKVIQLIGKK